MKLFLATLAAAVLSGNAAAPPLARRATGDAGMPTAAPTAAPTEPIDYGTVMLAAFSGLNTVGEETLGWTDGTVAASATGNAHIYIGSSLGGDICWDIALWGNWSGKGDEAVGMLTAAHVYAAPYGINGPAILHMFDTAPETMAYDDWGNYILASGCADDPDGIAAYLIEHPSIFYVQLHTDKYPMGAARGQVYPHPPEE